MHSVCRTQIPGEGKEIAYAQGGAFVRDDPDKALTPQEIALALYYSWDTLSQMEPSLEATVFLIRPASTSLRLQRG